jgi:NAD(P)-dependent dehydrogenase (short-subunit alcohol dehydrogenase family)
MKSAKKTALIAGAGGAAGVALCRTLRERGWNVVAAGRDRNKLVAELGDAADEILEVELTSEESVRRSVEVTKSLGDLEAMVYNAGRIDLAALADTTPEMFETSWRVNALGGFLCARAVAAPMVARARGTLVFVGATASLRGGAQTHAFASAKHALRGLANALAKELGPRGVHVAHLVIDGKVWGTRTRQRFPQAIEAECLDPTAVAAAICALIEQPRSAWTFEQDLRPSGEKWT